MGEGKRDKERGEGRGRGGKGEGKEMLVCNTRTLTGNVIDHAAIKFRHPANKQKFHSSPLLGGGPNNRWK